MFKQSWAFLLVKSNGSGPNDNRCEVQDVVAGITCDNIMVDDHSASIIYCLQTLEIMLHCGHCCFPPCHTKWINYCYD